MCVAELIKTEVLTKDKYFWKLFIITEGMFHSLYQLHYWKIGINKAVLFRSKIYDNYFNHNYYITGFHCYRRKSSALKVVKKYNDTHYPKADIKKVIIPAGTKIQHAIDDLYGKHAIIITPVLILGKEK